MSISNTKILITGSAGMLGSSMITVLREEGYEIYPTDKNIEKGIEYLDVREYDQVLKWATRLQPDFIFHLAAETDLEVCENDRYYAYATNTIGTQNVALICKKLGIKMVYICTAGIFDGKKEGFYNEFDEANPLSVYGQSKLEGGKIVREVLDQYFVCRPSWMIGGGAKDKKFVGKILKQIRDGQKDIYAVDDKFGTPTYTKDFCKNLAQLIKTEYYGVYNMVCRGSASRYDIAKEIVKVLNYPDINVHSVHSDYFAKTYPVNRPRSEMLDNFMLELRNLNQMRNWREIIAEYIEENFSEMIHKTAENNMIKQSSDKKKIIILGAGLAGLSCAYKLLQQGAEVVILEKNKEVGGLARTVKYKDFLFDFSAHRFVCNDHELLDEMKTIMKDNFVKRLKRSRILMWNRWFTYPFELSELILYMPKFLAVRAIIDYVIALIRQKINPIKIISFKDWFIASFGKTLYKTNCMPYASKHWRVDPSEIASEWGIARSPANFNLKTILKDLFSKKRASDLEENNPYPDADSFWYPKRGGCGVLAERLADEVKNLGGTICAEVEIKSININSQSEVKYKKYGKEYVLTADNIVSTIPVNKLVDILFPKVPEVIHTHLSKLKYLNTIFVNVIINRPKISDDSWLYFPHSSDDVVFVRAVEFKNWSDDMAPKDKTSLCLDISAMANEKNWTDNNDRELIERCRDGLLKSKIINRPEELEEGFVMKIPYTYPIFDLSYSQNLKPVINHLEDSGKLFLLGRTGRFTYANMDDVVRNSFRLASKLMNNI